MHDINLGAAIARERRAAQVTQGELAAHLGVTKAAVSKWELEQSMFDVALLPRIAAYFDLTLDELFDYRPQLVGDDLQDAYLRLLAQFDEDPEAAFANAEDLVRSHYSCWPALQQMGML
ncbi:MAG: helix-turn-helix transcriptional regulator, partial [Eggerthella lenta]